MSDAGRQGEWAGRSGGSRSPRRIATPLSVDTRAIEASTEADAARAPGERGQIPALTGLRFFAAFFILIAHTSDWIGQFTDSHISQFISFIAMYGMPLFFVLSGFVIHYNYRNLFIEKPLARAICEFAAARFARLYPLFFCFFLMAIAADSLPLQLYSEPNAALPILTYYLTLTQSWWYIIYGHRSIIYWIFSVSWSISTEMYFYLVYAVVIFVMLAACRRGRAFAAIAAYTILVAGGLGLARYHLSALLSWADHHIPDYVPIEPEFDQSFYRWLFYFSPYIRVLEFILGCLTAEAFLSVIHKKVSWTEQFCGSLALVVALAYLVLCGLVFNGVFNWPMITEYVQFFYLNFLCAPAIAVIIFCVARYDSIFARGMSAPRLVALGETSYSIYLVHSWTLRLFERPALPFTPYWAADTFWRMLCAIGFTLVVSYATYRLIEVPARRRVRRGLRHVIAFVFDRPRRQKRVARMAARPLAPRHHSHALYTATALAFLPVMALAGEAVRSQTVMDQLHHLAAFGRPEIEVITASYGANCIGFHVPSQFPSLAAIGNATAPARQICDGRQSCDLQVSFQRFADPAHGCGKDFSISYTCGIGEAARSAFASAEALDKHVLLQCPATRHIGKP